MWPRISIWQGSRDHTVDSANAKVLAAQWSELHGQVALPRTDQLTPGHRRRTWGRPDRPPSVELWTIPGIGHGFPIDPSAPASGYAGPWVVNAGLSAAPGSPPSGTWTVAAPRASSFAADRVRRGARAALVILLSRDGEEPPPPAAATVVETCGNPTNSGDFAAAA